MNVRGAQPRDLPAILDVDRVAAADRARAEMIERGVGDGRVIVADGERGVAGFLLHSDRLLGHPFIELLCVRDELRRQGVASLLLCEHLRVSPERRVFTSTNESNMPARRLFVRLGFIECGRIVGMDEGDPEIFFLWQRPTPASGSR